MIRRYAGAILWLGLALGLMAGCQRPSHNRRIYDRYAELVAERSRQTHSAAPAPASEPAPAATEVRPPASAPDPTPAPPPRRPAREPPPLDRRPIPPRPEEPPPPPVRVVPEAPSQPPVQVVPPPPAVAPQPVPPAAPEPPPPSLPPPSVSETDSTADGVAYTLKKGDLVQVFLRGIPSADAIEAIIDEFGQIPLPFIGEVVAEGQTASELARNIRRIYQEQGIYRNMSVNVNVPTRYYYVQGEIRGPGRYQIVASTRVSQAIAGAGGYTEFASGRVEIKRGGRIVKTIRNARRLDRNPQDDIILEPDDIIEVKRSRW